ncbi:MAG: response regulator [Chloroflexi bacterium]|nr:response regulator [Chloroflexota bacterium]
MNKPNASILIVEDDLDVAEMLDAYFRVQGYQVLVANWGEDGVKLGAEQQPDLIILDIRLPDIDGFEVAKRLKARRKTETIPVIFLTERDGREDRIQGLELGAVDYLNKPFDVQELRLKVRNALAKRKQTTYANTITGLPEGTLVQEELAALGKRQGWAALHVKLQNLAYFRDQYGFVAADDVLRAVSLMLQNAIREIGNTGDFAGHLSNTSFILVTSQATLDKLQARLESRLLGSLEYFYPLKDRAAAKGPQHLAIEIELIKPGQAQQLDALQTTVQST